ncbi:cytochrome P450 [Punctularia strigosozonata HHB-11173 SS5]|uniref:cytochrome P450 n=1 Tax=Punctularia strigosozonata (strain HHB-11173) TaxID=741275 RepID=UPI000441724D|nr:cytochrome P450 [Punctularia strigosozonata HHB-11173 SS5]EIN06727.1 cytochrome P450 [Punctularia strigosozonata HHB-11173 SS5]
MTEWSPFTFRCDFSWNPGFLPYGDAFQNYRKVMHRYVGPGAAAMRQPKQRKGVHDLLRRLVTSPDDLYSHIRFTTASQVLSIAYGIDAKREDDPYISVVERGNNAFLSAIQPGHWLVDAFPLLRHVPDWVPGAEFKRLAKAWRKCSHDWREIPFMAAKRAGLYSISVSAVSLYLDSLGEKADLPENHDFIKGISALMYAAAVDTTAATIECFFYEMLRNPHVQKQAQQELDSVLHGRLPDFTDCATLPYTRALVAELLRCQPVAPIGLPREIRDDDVYMGYYMPKGSVVIGNVWALTHDERVYPDPYAFKPERFLDEKGQLRPGMTEPAGAWGFGRRACPGRFLALDTIFLTVATVLTTFDILAQPGQVFTLDDDFETTGVTRHPKPFKCEIRPRSAAHARTAMATAEE